MNASLITLFGATVPSNGARARNGYRDDGEPIYSGKVVRIACIPNSWVQFRRIDRRQPVQRFKRVAAGTGRRGSGRNTATGWPSRVTVSASPLVTRSRTRPP